MREILFRGKRIDNVAWIKGCYTDLFDEERQTYIPTIVFQYFESASMDYPYPSCNTTWGEVDPKTVGQFTGITDKNKKNVFEGDIISHTRRTEKGIETTNHEVYFDTELLSYELRHNGDCLFNSQFNDEFKIIGNIHDNPELLNL